MDHLPRSSQPLQLVGAMTFIRDDTDIPASQVCAGAHTSPAGPSTVLRASPTLSPVPAHMCRGLSFGSGTPVTADGREVDNSAWMTWKRHRVLTHRRHSPGRETSPGGKRAREVKPQHNAVTQQRVPPRARRWAPAVLPLLFTNPVVSNKCLKRHVGQHWVDGGAAAAYSKLFATDLPTPCRALQTATVPLRSPPEGSGSRKAAPSLRQGWASYCKWSPQALGHCWGDNKIRGKGSEQITEWEWAIQSASR